jgi:hypothetical protein
VKTDVLSCNIYGLLGCIEPLLAAATDITHPLWRAASLDGYRFWRDLGFVCGAIGIGFIVDIFNLNIAIQAVT